MNTALLFFAIALYTQPARSQLLSSPINTIAKIGHRVELECSTNTTLPIIWRFKGINSTQIESIYLNGQITHGFSSRYKVNTTVNGRWDLVIDSVAVDQAGTYRCENTETYDPQAIVMKISAELIVIDSYPVCGASTWKAEVMEGDYIQMWCTVNYSGNWILVMEWTRNDEQTIYKNINITYESNKVTSSLMKQLVSSDNGITFTCNMSLNPNATNNIPAQVDTTEANNIPYYRYSWNYTTTVLYGPKNQTIILIDDSLKTRSRFECFADGNPVPSYEWEIVGNKIPRNNGSIVVISDSMISDEEQTLRCRAWNSVDGQIRSIEATYTLSFTQTPASSNQYIVLTVSGVLAVIGLGALGLGVALTVKACRKGNLVKCERCKELSLHPQDYEMVDECNQKTGVFGKPSTNLTIAKKGGTEYHSLDTTDCENYSALKRRSSATFPQPGVYAELQQYANTGI